MPAGRPLAPGPPRRVRGAAARRLAAGGPLAPGRRWRAAGARCLAAAALALGWRVAGRAQLGGLGSAAGLPRRPAGPVAGGPGPAQEAAATEELLRRQVGFGKHKGLTYREVMVTEPSYCDRFARAHVKPKHEFTWPFMFDFVQAMRRLGFPRDAAERGDLRRVGFGKYYNLTYREALNQDPDYCDWFLTLNCPAQGRAQHDFVLWLRVERRVAAAQRDFVRWQEPAARGYAEGGDPRAGAAGGGRSSSGVRQAGQRMAPLGVLGLLQTRTFQEVFDEDPELCRGLVEVATKWGPREICEPILERFIQWLLEGPLARS